MSYFKLSLFFVLFFSLLSCKKEKEIILDDTATGGALVATIDGMDFKATKSVFVDIRPFGVDDEVSFIINGRQEVGNNEETLQVTIYNYKGTGSYKIGTPTENIALFNNLDMETNERLIYRADKDYVQNTGTGKLNIVSVTSERITGSFEYTCISEGGESKFVKGQFSAKL